MAIWGKRDQEPAAEEPSAEVTPAAATPENQPPAGASPENDPEVSQAPGAAAAAQEPPAATASPGSPGSPGGISPQRWSEILVAFVDDPRGSVKMAADAVDQAIEEVVTSVRARQRALASSWQGSDTDTEQLRTVLREYRRFGIQVQQMSPAGPAGGGTAAAS
jgi:hypothetical protein